MGTEENKAVVRRFYEGVMNASGPADLDPLMHEDFVDHGETLFGSPKGREILEGGINYVHGILPNLHVNLEDMIASGDMVGVRGGMSVTHTGPLAGVEATGNELKWNGIAMFRIKDGKIAERWFNSDSLNIAIQLGIYSPGQH
jgi:predicted ester cyclase